MEFPKRYWRNFDWQMLVAVVLLIGFGLIIVYSASYSKLLQPGDDPLHYVRRQAIGALIGLAAMLLVLVVDYRVFRRWARLLYAAVLALLILVLTSAPIVLGSQRWLRLGPVTFQPSEVAKIAMIVLLARYLEKNAYPTGWQFLIPFLLTLLPMVLILLQPDLGTSLVFLGILFSMLYLAGAKTKHLLAAGGSAALLAASAVVLSLQGWLNLIRPYQITRLLIFLDPYADRTHAGWNVIQSMIAVGSGGFLGKGLLSGSQNQLNFLPANHTDFVFSVVAEEFGFVGSVCLLLVYLFIIKRGLRIAILAKDRFGTMLAVGCVGMLFFHVIINVGMALGIMPVTGLPLPFITYGGSTLVTFLIAIGLLLNVGLRRHKIMF